MLWLISYSSEGTQWWTNVHVLTHLYCQLTLFLTEAIRWRINMNDKTIKNEKNKKPQKLPSNTKEGKSYILNRPQFDTTLNNLFKWKIMLKFIWTDRIRFGPIEHTELSVQMTDKNICFSESLQSHPLYFVPVCLLSFIYISIINTGI